jgi:hypothetical protein
VWNCFDEKQLTDEDKESVKLTWENVNQQLLEVGEEPFAIANWDEVLRLTLAFAVIEERAQKSRS